jgi:hypothetical protein
MTGTIRTASFVVVVDIINFDRRDVRGGLDEDVHVLREVGRFDVDAEVAGGTTVDCC